MPDTNTRHVVVTTEYRGVFFGRLIEHDRVARIATLADARNCLCWGATVRGFLGLAAKGPDSSCRIGPAVPRLDLVGVTSIADCTPDAVAKWEDEPWQE